MGDAPVFTCSLWVTKSSLLFEDTQMFWRKDARYYQLFGDMPKSGTCTSLLQPQSYMENLNAASKEL